MLVPGSWIAVDPAASISSIMTPQTSPHGAEEREGRAKKGEEGKGEEGKGEEGKGEEGKEGKDTAEGRDRVGSEEAKRAEEEREAAAEEAAAEEATEVDLVWMIPDVDEYVRVMRQATLMARVDLPRRILDAVLRV